MNNVKNFWFVISITLISAFRIFLATNTNYAIIAGKFDDELAIHWGYTLLSGEWLGNYSYTTLIKGITYPCFVALIKLLGLTYGQGMGILMIVASLIFIRMIYKFNKNRFFLLISYIFVLFNPAGFSGWTALHIYRDTMTIWLLLILFSCVIALYDNRKLAWKFSVGWIAGALSSFVMLYYLREDSIWIYPFIILSFLICAISHYFPQRINCWSKNLLSIVFFTILPWICVGIVGVVISSLNFRYYGIFCINDRTQGPFAEMMELIYQVEDDSTDENVWITDGMLWKCVDASPTLRNVKDQIESRFEAAKEEDSQIHGDFLQWELRTAFRDAGYYQDASETQRMIQKIVVELKDAYKKGILKRDNKIHLSAQGRGMTFADIIRYIPIAVERFFDVANYEGCYSYYPYYPQAKEELVDKFEIMLSLPLSKEYIDSPIYVFTENFYSIINKVYHKLGRIILNGCCIVFCISTIREVLRYKREKVISKELELSLPIFGIMLSGYLLIYMITVFTTFLTVYNFYNYTTGIYAIHSIFEILIINNLWYKGLKMKEYIKCKK